MIKKIIKFSGKIVVSSFLLYGYNILIQPMGLIIPINIITVLIISILGIPSFLCLIFLMLYAY